MLDGKIVASLDFADEAKQITNLHYADQLVAICKHYGFEGYLMNYEVKIENTKVLMEWLKYL
jgi:endo-beta-N-acetylglucosaminidase D